MAVPAQVDGDALVVGGHLGLHRDRQGGPPWSGAMQVFGQALWACPAVLHLDARMTKVPALQDLEPLQLRGWAAIRAPLEFKQ